MKASALSWASAPAALLTALAIQGCARRPFRPPPTAARVTVELNATGKHTAAASLQIDTGTRAPSAPYYNARWIDVYEDATWELARPQDPCRTSNCYDVIAHGAIDPSGELVGLPAGLFLDAKDVWWWVYYGKPHAWIEGVRVPEEKLKRLPI
jgi:hypothetical protein